MIEKTGALSVVLAELRDLVRLSQKALAKASGVSEGTIRDIETGMTVSKPATLKKLAVALAHDPLTGQSDAARVDAVYQRLLTAAGHIPESRVLPEIPLSVSLSAPTRSAPPREDDRSVVKRNLESRYGEDAHFVEQVLDRLETQEHPQRLTILRLLLGGIGDALGRSPLVREQQLSR